MHVVGSLAIGSINIGGINGYRGNSQDVPTSISTSCFANSGSLHDVTLLSETGIEVISSIGDNAFKNCTTLNTITIQNNAEVVTLGNNVFDGCDSLKHIYVPSSLVNNYKSASG
jgi:hypothetical protein